MSDVGKALSGRNRFIGVSADGRDDGNEWILVTFARESHEDK